MAEVFFYESFEVKARRWQQAEAGLCRRLQLQIFSWNLGMAPQGGMGFGRILPGWNVVEKEE